MLKRQGSPAKNKSQKGMSSPKKSSAATSPTSSAPDLSIRSDKVAILSTGYTKPTSEQREDYRNPESDDGHDDDNDTSSRDEDAGSDESAVVSRTARFRQSPWDFFREIGLHVSGTGWRSYDNFIGQPIFYNGFSERMKAAVLSSPLLQEKIRYLADRRVKSEDEQGSSKQWAGKQNRDGNEDNSVERRASVESSLQKVAEKLIDNMICKMESKMFIRGAYYFAIQLLTRAYHQGRVQ